VAKIMKRKLSALSEQYVTALRKHLKEGPRASLKPARGLGQQAVTLGMETLDMARIHEGALATLKASGEQNGIGRAQLFFAEAVTPIEKTHRASIKADADLHHANKRLAQRTNDLAVSDRSLKRSIVRRKTVEKALKKSGGDSKKLLEESRRLQKHLQFLTHQILTAQENKRKKMSRDLEDEIAQTLLGINIRLLALKKEAMANAEGLKKDIASTQRLVDKAGKTMKRFAREIGKHDE
jgi:two-component system, NarL family, sensor histidine kinase DegS